MLRCQNLKPAGERRRCMRMRQVINRRRCGSGNTTVRNGLVRQWWVWDATANIFETHKDVITVLVQLFVQGPLPVRD